MALIFVGPGIAEEVSQKLDKFNLQGYADNGDKAWDVNGDHANIEGNNIDITNVDANRFGDQDINLKAKKGTIDKTSGKIHLEKDVVITSESGSTLKTDSLDWEKEKDLVSTDDLVVITDKGMEAVGKGLTAHPGQQTAQMHNDVTVKVNTEPEKPLDGRIVTVTCDGPMEVDQAKNMAVFNVNVVAVQSDRTLKADRMELYFDPTTKQIKQTICIGHVIIVQGENETYADKAVYDGPSQKLTLTGRPKLIMLTEGEGSIGSFKQKE